METLKRTTQANPRDFNNDGLDHFNYFFKDEIKINALAVSSCIRLRIGITEKEEVEHVKRFFGMSTQGNTIDKLVCWITVFEISMINGDRFYSLDEPEFLK